MKISEVFHNDPVNSTSQLQLTCGCAKLVLVSELSAPSCSYCFLCVNSYSDSVNNEENTDDHVLLKPERDEFVVSPTLFAIHFHMGKTCVFKTLLFIAFKVGLKSTLHELWGYMFLHGFPLININANSILHHLFVEVESVRAKSSGRTVQLCQCRIKMNRWNQLIVGRQYCSKESGLVNKHFSWGKGGGDGERTAVSVGNTKLLVSVTLEDHFF